MSNLFCCTGLEHIENADWTLLLCLAFNDGDGSSCMLRATIANLKAHQKVTARRVTFFKYNIIVYYIFTVSSYSIFNSVQDITIDTGVISTCTTEEAVRQRNRFG